jgi:DNA-binding MarR family transcriptional regulator
MTPRRAADRDHVDRFLDEIRSELPADLDLEVEGIVDRINGINWRIRKMLDETLDQYDLTSGDWKVLCSLHWKGKPHRRSAGELARIADLSSGAMTNRLDRLEKAGFVKRLPDPNDRRGVVVEITKAGQKAWLESAGAEAAQEALIAAALSDREKKQLNSLLRRLMLEFERREGSEGKKI